MSLPTCPTCVYAKGICKKTGVEIRTTTGCTYHTPKPITNADRIRAMTDEDLVNKLYLGVCVRHFDDSQECKDNGCRKCWFGWLKQEANDVGQ